MALRCSICDKPFQHAWEYAEHLGRCGIQQADPHDEEIARLRADLASAEAKAAAMEAGLLRFRADLATVTAERDRLRDEMAAERGERGPEGWTYQPKKGGWVRERIGFFAGVDGNLQDGYTWELARNGYDLVEGEAPTALAAMEAAARAAKE